MKQQTSGQVMKRESSGPSLGRRALAFVILLVAGWILLHFIIHIAIAIVTTVVIVLAIVAGIWALKTVL